MCDSHADSVYTHICHPPYQDWTIAHGHLRLNHSHSSSHQFETQGTKTQAKTWLTVLHRRQQQTSQPKQSISSTYHFLQLQKILPDRFPVMHSVQN